MKIPAREYRTLIIFFSLVIILAALMRENIHAAGSGLNVTNMSDLTPEDLANTLVGGGIEVSNVTYTGSPLSAGRFDGGTGIIGFERGIVLSSGSVRNVRGPNTDEGVTTVTSTDGDSDLNSLVPSWITLDAAVLEFDIVPENDTISFQYVLASDEYNEFVNTPFSDVFGFFLDGVNIAMVPGTSVPVSINSINNGRPYGSRKSAQNPEYFINNDPTNGGGALNTEMDGLTVVLPVQASVQPGQKYHLKLAIADVTDRFIDSAIFIRSGSLSGTHPPVAGDDSATTLRDQSVDIDVLRNDSDADDDTLTVTGVTDPMSGDTAIVGNGIIRYTPNDGFVGTDIFSYAIDDGNSGVGTATVTVKVRVPAGEEPPTDLEFVNQLISIDNLSTFYDSGDVRAGAGVYRITATFTNIGDRDLSDLVFEALFLTGSNVLLNADGGPAAQGATLSVPNDTFADGFLDPGESFSQRFEIGVATTQPFSFFVNILASAP